MSFFPKKMSQNDWATIMPFGPVTLIFYWPKKIFSGQPKASPHLRHCLSHILFGSLGFHARKDFKIIWLSIILTLTVPDEDYSKNVSSALSH